MTTAVMLKDVRLSFPDLWKAIEFKTGDGKPRYNATFLIEPDSANDKALKDAILAEAKAAFGAKWEQTLKGMVGNTNKYCYLDGDLKDYDGYKGMRYLACHSKTRPTVIDRNKTPLTAEDGKPYAGCYVNAKVEIWAQTGENVGMRASFTGLQFARDGDAFAGGTPADPNEFDSLEEGADASMMV